MPRRSLLTLPLLLIGTAAYAQVPAGFELVVNTATGVYGSQPTVEMDDSGRFVVGWATYNGENSPDKGPFIRRYAADGTPLAPRFLLSPPGPTLGANLSLSGNGKGEFVVSWRNSDAHARLFDASGQPRGAITLPDELGNFRVATAANGSFVVAWHNYAFPEQGVRLHRYDRDGRSLGDLVVSAGTATTRQGASVAGAPDGRLVVAWEAGQFPSHSIQARRVDASGGLLGDEFRASTVTSDDQGWSWNRGLDHTAAMAPDGSFIVTWTGGDVDHYAPNVFAQRFDAAGNRLGAAFQVNSATVIDAYSSRVAADGSGNFVIVWSERPTNSTQATMVRRYDASGTPRSVPFQVDSGGTRLSVAPMVDSDAVGNFVVTWDSFYANPGASVRARRFGGLLPAAMTVDTAGNGVLEPGESVTVAPSWRNVNGNTQMLTGTLTRLTGPAGGTYTITGGAASYGSIPNATTGSCGASCYGVSVEGARPATHWDAVATERLAPDSQGQMAAWRLHLGDSFTDVPRVSPFYRYVETLLHRGVTGGCGAATYCPTASTTREQMAVFVLVAKEGALYTPPACSTPVFSDVPASSPYCRWIEELARRGVATGCGGGTFCPSAAVTRDQMAVFVLRTLDPGLSPPACTTPVFADVPAASPYCRWIEELARRGIVSGCGGGNYCPTEVVTREQMSVFLAGTFGLTLYGP